uniref:Selenoprotein H n=1 Tax=Aegilops tauschii TaxID=37682 RepID=R7W0I5_AEGTA
MEKVVGGDVKINRWKGSVLGGSSSFVRVCVLFRKTRRRRLVEDGIRFSPPSPVPMVRLVLSEGVWRLDPSNLSFSSMAAALLDDPEHGRRERAADAPAKKEEAEAAPAAAGGKGRKKAKKEVSAVETVLSPPAAAKQKVKKNAKKEVVAAAVDDGGAGAESGKRVIVEACTQCQQFKRRALKVKEDLESAVPGVSVTINPEKPRRGCLEIREEGGDVFISLQNMPRPFKKMRELDMDKVIKDIAQKIA